MTFSMFKRKYGGFALVLGIIFGVTALVVSLQLANQPTRLRPEASMGTPTGVQPIFSSSGFVATKTSKVYEIDFSEANLGLLDNQYFPTYGVVFSNNIASGWALYKEQGYAHTMSLPSNPQLYVYPGGSSLKFTLPKGARRVGMQIQPGIQKPKDSVNARVVITAYAANGQRVMGYVASTFIQTCVAEVPCFIGLESYQTKYDIKTFEMSLAGNSEQVSPYFSIGNLTWQYWRD